MQFRVGLTAIAVGMSMMAGPAGGQAAGSGGARGQAPARACVGECPEERAEALRELVKARAEMERLARVLAQRSDSLDTRQLAEARTQLIATLTRIEQLERRAVRERQTQVMIARVQAQAPSIVREGWLGVSFSSAYEVIQRNGEPRLVRFLAYPVVEAVEPASPARRAGIEVGDVLLAFQDKDLRSTPIALDALLTPGRRLPVLLRRGQDRKTVTVVVGEQPRGGYAVISPTEAPQVPPRVSVVGTPEVRALPRAPLPPEPAEARVWVYGPSTGSVALAGAQMAILPSQLREQVNAEGGLLVLRVAYGTPASRAGLRDGDVIVSAGGTAVRSSGDLQRAFRSAENRTVTLQVVRQREPVTLRVSW